MTRLLVCVAAINGLIAVAGGAFGAHALKSRLEAPALNAFETAVRYQMYHALALLGVAWWISREASRWATASGICFLVGILLFSGSLYGLSLLGWRWLGPVTPLGGLLMICGWLCFAVAAVRAA